MKYLEILLKAKSIEVVIEVMKYELGEGLLFGRAAWHYKRCGCEQQASVIFGAVSTGNKREIAMDTTKQGTLLCQSVPFSRLRAR
jgi:hypothetical protein